ncbi:MAG: iron ABC transporter permease, partial [Rhodoplanes sp.]
MPSDLPRNGGGGDSSPVPRDQLEDASRSARCVRAVDELRPRPARAVGAARPAHPVAIALLILVAALPLAPIASLLHIALQGDTEIWRHLFAYVLPTALRDTVLLLAGVSAIAAIVGVSAAWLVTAYQFPGRNLLVWLLPLPLAFPTYIVAYVYVDVLDALGPVQNLLRSLTGWRSPADYWFPEIRSLGGAVFVIGIVLYPYVYLAARTMFQTQSVTLIEVARGLGARRWRLARDVTLPLARPAIATGLTLVLLETLNDIGASEYLGVNTLTLSIFTTWLNRGSLAGAAQIACVMLVVVAALIALERAARRGRQYAGLDRDPRLRARHRLRGPKRYAAAVVCFIPVALGFVVPFLFLANQVIRRELLVGFDPDLFGHALTTIALSASATVITLALGFGVAFAHRFVRRPFAAVCVSIAGLGYAVPGTVLALGLLAPLIAFDDLVNAATQAFAGQSVGLLLAGSSASLVIAYVVRFLALATGFAQAGLARITPDLDDAACNLGARPATVLRTVYLPLTRTAVLSAALLVFVDCLKELPATLLLRPLNVETLSTYIYQFATRGSFEDGALAALLIVLVGLLPVIRM